MTQPRAFVRILTGQLKGGAFVLEDVDVCKVGSSDSCLLKLPDDTLAPEHGVLLERNGNWEFRTIGDATAFVNDIPTRVRRLGGGEVIRVGSTEIQFTFQLARKGEVESSRSREANASSDPRPAIGRAEPVADAVVEPAAVGTQSLRIRVADGHERDVGREVVLEPGKAVTIGRSLDADLTLADNRISRMHCQLELSDGVVTTKDLDSSNGTKVGGERITEAVWSLGTSLVVGVTVLELVAAHDVVES